MVSPSKGNGRVLWAQILICATILLIVGSFVARIVYGQQMREAEDKWVASLGISPDVHFVVKIVVAILALWYLCSRYGPFRRTI
ncbi:MAG TPA: hypothetical protein VK581_05480 [Chthoniobacterales bacterium]|nr:hypothetical protein [Chthoniobacterales bacterium]